MPRPKGSKNKVKTTKVTADFAAQIAAKQEEKAAVEAEILKVAASIEELKTDVKSLNADLKAKKASVKKLDKEVAKLEARQAAAAQKAAEASKKAEAEDVLVGSNPQVTQRFGCLCRFAASASFLFCSFWLCSLWWAQVDSNHRPHAYQACALTT